MKFVLSGKMDKEKYQGKIEALGGKVSNSVTKETIALISDKGRKMCACASLINLHYFTLIEEKTLINGWLCMCNHNDDDQLFCF